MRTCPFCGAASADDAEICSSCGVMFSSWEEQNRQKTVKPEIQTGGKKNVRLRTVSRTNHRNGGLVAWAVFVLLLCHIGASRILEDYLLAHLLCFVPGLVALAQAVNVNNSDSESKRENRENICFLLCIVGTVLGIVLNLIKA